MSNIALEPYPNPSSYRRIAAVAWPEPRDPHIYGSLEIRCEALEAWIAAQREKTGQKLTVTHAVVRALAMIYQKHPALNAVVRFGSLYKRRDIDIFVQVAIEDEAHIGHADLSGVKIKNAERYSAPEIEAHLREKARKIRSKQDEEFERTKTSTTLIPGWLLGPVLRLIDFFQYTLNINPSFLGTPSDPFGSAMVTNVGVFGITKGYAPFFPLARCGIIVTLGGMETKAVVEGDRVVPGRVLHVNGTFDHRVVDGYHGGIVARELKALLENPQRLEVG